jgi:thioredoxin reductase
MHSDLYDITIIGGGPVGLFGAFYAGLRGMRTKIIDSLPELGGQLTALYPEKYVYDMPGFPEVLAKDLAHAMIRQAMRFKPTVCLESAPRRSPAPTTAGQSPPTRGKSTTRARWSSVRGLGRSPRAS